MINIKFCRGVCEPIQQFQYGATNTAPHRYYLVGNFPAGMSIDQGTGLLEFDPTQVDVKPAVALSGQAAVIVNNCADTDQQDRGVNKSVVNWEVEQWPPEISYTPYAASTSVAMAAPAYLQSAVDTETPQTQVIKVSDQSAFGSSSLNNFGPMYGLHQHFSADNKHAIVFSQIVDPATGAWAGFPTADGINTSLAVIDACTGAFSHWVQDAVANGTPRWRWSNVDSDTLYFVGRNPPRVFKHSVSAQANTIYRDFVADGFDLASSGLMGGTGFQSIDDTMFPLALKRAADQVWGIVMWDAVANTIGYTIETYASVANGGASVDPGAGAPLGSYGISHTGQYLWVSSPVDWQAKEPGNAGLTAIPRGVSIFNAATGAYTGNTLQNFAPPNTTPVSHAHPSLDENGQDVWVHFGNDEGDATPEWQFASWRMDGSNGQASRVEIPEGVLQGYHYISGVVFDCPDWIVISDYPRSDGPPNQNGQPMGGKIWAFRVDGSQRIYQIGDSRHSEVNYTSINNNLFADYYWYSFATPNRDLSQILFKSAFDLDWSDAAGGVPTEMHAFLARCSIT